MNEIDTAMGMEYGWIIGLVVLVVIVVLIFMAMRPKGNTPVPKYKSPMDILKKRYAKGEISKEEYEEKKRQIT